MKTIHLKYFGISVERMFCACISIALCISLTSCEGTLAAIKAGAIDGLNSGIASGLASPTTGGGYAYHPQAQYHYVQTPQRQPGGGYTPQPQQIYVQTPQRQPGGGYTPQPQQIYVQTPQRQPGGGYTPQPQLRYKSRSEMTPSELKALDSQTPKPLQITADPWLLSGKPNIDKHEAAKAQYGPTVKKGLDAVEWLGNPVGIEVKGGAAAEKAVTSSGKGVLSKVSDWLFGKTVDYNVEKIRGSESSSTISAKK
jgi:hypothetical protein